MAAVLTVMYGGELSYPRIWRDLRTLSLPSVLLPNLNACVIKVHARKATHAYRICLAGLATKKSGGTITPLHT